ncbi:MAG: hypothetical protein CVU72_00040 [Deltaproteobacteria bacterium HGW-Deltaproteobacteria-7]|jgi:hypothetical protein|nr:MAG: hypothetical protein CVU72_00040 [Deltaproteobacteria bacterium HGW-Deltaproteobacteria-7]PKN20774.1 MAG: hypothetical protein CVU71_03060 [Deltaproteobacteria bacterium HGW-Deltaproteobacteria-6]
MEISKPLFLQLFIDLALLVSIIVLLWRVNVNLKKPLMKSHEAMMRELKTITAESQAASENFLRALEQSRLALKEIALELDLKEQRVKTLLAKSESVEADAAGKRAAYVPQDKYEQVIQMIRKGCSEANVAEATGFTEPEVGLIVDLYRVKNENA